MNDPEASKSVAFDVVSGFTVVVVVVIVVDDVVVVVFKLLPSSAQARGVAAASIRIGRRSMTRASFADPFLLLLRFIFTSLSMSKGAFLFFFA